MIEKKKKMKVYRAARASREDKSLGRTGREDCSTSDDEDRNELRGESSTREKKKKKNKVGRLTRTFVFLSVTMVIMVIMDWIVVRVGADKNKEYEMDAVCKNHFLRDVYRKIDGAVVTSQNERDLNCAITFQTHSILQRFMLKFDRLELDCNDHLYIYDGAHLSSNIKVDLSCRNTVQMVGAIYTQTNHVTLKYVTDGWGTDLNGFRLIITAVKDQKHPCNDFRCSLQQFCIAKDLVCDGVSHCEDGSDESTSTLCANLETSTILGLESVWFVLTVVCLILGSGGFLIFGVFCFYRQRTASPRYPHLAHNTQINHPAGYPLVAAQYSGTNGTSGTMPLGMTNLKMGPISSGLTGATTLPRPGNWLHPVGLRLGHSAARVRLYCQAK